MWIARCRDKSLMAFNTKPLQDNFDYYVRGNYESEDFTDYGVELPTWVDVKLIGKHIEFEDGAFRVE